MQYNLIIAVLERIFLVYCEVSDLNADSCIILIW